MMMITNGNLQVLIFQNGKETLETFYNIGKQRVKLNGTVRVIIDFEEPMFLHRNISYVEELDNKSLDWIFYSVALSKNQ